MNYIPVLVAVRDRLCDAGPSMNTAIPERTNHGAARHDEFAHSLAPMLICDERRRCLDANVAACLFLRLGREAVIGLRIDDLLATDQHPQLRLLWPAVVRAGATVPAGALACQLTLPDGAQVAARVLLSTLRPGRHLAVIEFPPLRALIGDQGRAAPAAGRTLTRRERQVLALVAAGNTGVDIAALLFLSPATVQTHVTNALVKLNARNRAHGIALAIRSGEIDVDDPSGDAAHVRRLAS